MTSTSVSAAAVAAAPLSAASGSMTKAGAIARAAHDLLLHLERGQRIDAPMLRTAMESAFGASDADGGWNWKTAYDACEAATVLFLRKFGPAMRAQCSIRLPRCCRCWQRSTVFFPPTPAVRKRAKRFSNSRTPIAIGICGEHAAAITPADVVLEPSAGTGLLAILAELAGASLVLNELADTRAGHPSIGSFPACRDTVRCRADRRSSRCWHRAERRTDEPAVLGGRSRRSPHGGRSLAACRVGARRGCPTAGAWLRSPARASPPDNPAWTDAFVHLQERGRVVFSAAIDGGVYAKHGTTTETRLTVIDRLPADDATAFPPSRRAGR